MKIIWSEKYILSDYIYAPKNSGVYMIGLNIPMQQNKNDSYLGENFPNNFIARYIGISKSSLRSRLYCHFSKRGNKYIKEHILEYGANNLEFVYCVTKATEIEHHFLENTMEQFIWNTKQSEYGAWAKILRSL